MGLCLKDIQHWEREYGDAKDKAKRANKKLPDIFVETMDKVGDYLKNNQLIGKQKWTAIEVEKINETLPRLITSKPVIYLLNCTEKVFFSRKNKWLAKVHEWIQAHGGGTTMLFSAEFEERLNDAKDDQAALDAIKAESPHAVSSMEKIVKAGFKELNLLNFFTTGEDEVRSWTVYKGATAPNAAGAIHGDMEKCFIKAEVCAYDDFIANTKTDVKVSMAGAKAAGKYRVEGKAYVVQDGDIIQIMHNAKK